MAATVAACQVVWLRGLLAELTGMKKQKTKNNNHDNRLLITVNVVGSSGPLRFVVKKNDKVSTVIDSSLKLYARGGRLPVLGSDVKNFMFYALIEGSGVV
uniref:DUF7054 domain-containing protein n=1 Tax=Lactuca sativa TaxID=4236 RepID=A0A9R1VLJ3_LACSA|nr:hypothetical protein LSAT_V11C400213980 [Lactuca sativa]